MSAIDDKEAEHEWDVLWNEQKDAAATRAGLLRSSAFTRSLPYWSALPRDWHEPLSTMFKADREKRKADEAARSVEAEKRERAELARLLAKYGAALETCPAPKQLETQLHGHVTPRSDGVKARCGGPAICGTCARELAALNRRA